MNIANKLTLARVVLIPIFLVILYQNLPFGNYIALGVFIVASLTDFVDGYIARHRNMVTDFGKFMDPLADKLLVFSAMLWFVEAGRFPAWAVLIILARELAVTGLRLIAVEGGRVIAAGWSGKVKTFSTMICLCLMLLFQSGGLMEDTAILDTVCLDVILATTVYSGVEYFMKNKDVFKGKAM